MEKEKLKGFLDFGIMSISELAKIAGVDRKRIYDILNGEKVSIAVSEKLQNVISQCDTKSKTENQLKDEWFAIPTFIRNKSKFNEFLYCECRKTGFTEFTIKQLIQRQYEEAKNEY